MELNSIATLVRGVYWRVALNGVLVASGAGVEAAYEVHGLQGDNHINIYLASGYLDVYLPYFQPTFIYDVQ